MSRRGVWKKKKKITMHPYLKWHREYNQSNSAKVVEKGFHEVLKICVSYHRTSFTSVTKVRREHIWESIEDQGKWVCYIGDNEFRKKLSSYWAKESLTMSYLLHIRSLNGSDGTVHELFGHFQECVTSSSQQHSKEENQDETPQQVITNEEKRWALKCYLLPVNCSHIELQ